MHARIALLSGLSPKENRSIPPLNYERVYALKRRRPELNVWLNGGIVSAAECTEHLSQTDGVMVGRQAYQDPWFLTELEREFGAGRPALTRASVVDLMLDYIEDELTAGAQLKHISRHMLGLFAGQPGARAWRRHLSERAHLPGAGTDVLLGALSRVPTAA